MNGRLTFSSLLLGLSCAVLVCVGGVCERFCLPWAPSRSRLGRSVLVAILIWADVAPVRAVAESGVLIYKPTSDGRLYSHRRDNDRLCTSERVPGQMVPGKACDRGPLIYTGVGLWLTPRSEVSVNRHS